MPLLMPHTRSNGQFDMNDTQASPAAVPDISFIRQLGIAWRAFWEADTRYRIIILATVLLAIILLTTYGQILLNRWNVPFYNALEQRDIDAFLHQLGIFALIAGGLLALNVIQTFLSQMIALYMREGLSRDVVDHWLANGRAYRLSVSSPLGVNPDQRLHEDARKLAEMTTTLSIGLVQATILLASFVGVLWQMSTTFVINIAGHSLSIPGYMVWGALIYAGAASLLTQLVGWRLTRLNADRYAGEADLRFTLMRANENLEAITVSRGEATERRHIHAEIDNVLAKIRSLAYALTNLTWVTAGFGWLAIIVPTLIASPAYFDGTITFGGLMMAAAAFTQVYAALRWYVDNFGAIADWKATLLRVTVFKAALAEMETSGKVASGIEVVNGDEQAVSLCHLEITSAPGASQARERFRIAEGDCLIKPGEKIMINGDPGVNRKLLFNALAGIWPWGAGKVGLPPDDEMLFLPQLEYLPEGRLRSILAYPRPSADFSDQQFVAALVSLGMERLSDHLDQRARWDRLLDRDEQMQLAFANILLRRPRWIVFNDVLEGLEPETIERIASVMKGLTDTTMIYVGRSSAYQDALSPRLLHLERIESHQQADPSDLQPA